MLLRAISLSAMPDSNLAVLGLGGLCPGVVREQADRGCTAEQTDPEIARRDAGLRQRLSPERRRLIRPSPSPRL